MQPSYSSHTVTTHVESFIAQGHEQRCHRVSRIVSSVRRPSAASVKKRPTSLPTQGRMELDSHADTIVLGANTIILSHTGQSCEVLPYSDTYDSITDVPVVTGATLWTSPHDGDEFILIFNEALWMGDTLQHTLINPNQLRAYGTIVQDNPFASTSLKIEPINGPTIPLATMGTIIYCDSRAPNDRELSSLPHIHLSSSATWDPHNVIFPTPQEDHQTHISSIRSSANDLTSTIHDLATFHSRLISSVQVHAPSKSPEDLPSAPTFQCKGRHSSVSPQDLSERWFIGLKKAKDTIQKTTQRIQRSALLPLARRYRADRMYERPRIRGIVYTDTMDGQHKSLDGNKYAQIFATDFHFSAVYPMESKGMAGEALKQFIADFGVPDKIICDGSKEQTKRGTTFVGQARKHHIDLHTTKPGRYNQSKVEGVIRELRKNWFRTMHHKRVPKRLWDYGLKWVSEVRVRTSSDAADLKGRTPLERITGDTVDISEYLDFSFYDWCWYHENAGLGPTKLGRWLGVAHKVGSLMSYWVLTINCTVIARTTVQRVTSLELQVTHMKERTQAFDEATKMKIKDNEHVILQGGKTQPHDWSDHPFSEDPDFTEEMHEVVSNDELKDADDDFTPDVYDTYLNMELAIPQGDSLEPRLARVTKRLKDANGLPIGLANENPILDTRMYEVEYLDGERASLAANNIAENLFAQIDDDGNRQVLMDEIIGHRSNDHAVKQQDAFISTNTGTKRRRETTKGWELLVRWKDGGTDWVALKDIKESYPVQVAEYAVSSRISEEPAFAWWSPSVLKKRSRIIAKTKSKYWLRMHKFGIEIPKSVQQARQIDAKCGNTLWWEAICKEMKNVRPAFEVFEGDDHQLPDGFQEIKCHMIFDVKIGENFRRKARLVAGGHTTDAPATLTYSSVVSRDSVRIALTIAALNGLEVMACDIQNAYLTADCREKIWTRAGPEFGSESGTIMLIRKALYGLKSSGAAFRAHLAETLYDIGFVPTQADPDVWRRPAVKEDGFEYYEYMLCYVDDILAISHKAKDVLKAVQTVFKLKDDRIEPPDMYLGATLSTMEDNGCQGWSMTSDKYVKAAVENVELELLKINQRLPSRCKTPMTAGYRPERDVSAELTSVGIQRYQELIGVLRWAAELGRVDILLETAMLSTYMALPRKGHLEQVYHVFGYLKTHPKRRLFFDPRHPDIDERAFSTYQWYDFYRDAKEQVPTDMPPPSGHAVSTHCFVDADHASNTVTRRSQTGILIFLSRAPIVWYSKRQNTVRTSTFGSEFIAMRTAVEHIEALRYKLRMFGIPIEGPTNVFCNNEAVFKNTTIPESTLKKKHNSICYHRCREAVAARVMRVAKEGTLTNLADLFTKPLMQAVREGLLDRFTY